MGSIVLAAPTPMDGYALRVTLEIFRRAGITATPCPAGTNDSSDSQVACGRYAPYQTQQFQSMWDSAWPASASAINVALRAFSNWDYLAAYNSGRSFVMEQRGYAVVYNAEYGFVMVVVSNPDLTQVARTNTTTLPGYRPTTLPDLPFDGTPVVSSRPSSGAKGTLERVIDGRIAFVELESRERYPIRLAGVDVPEELQQPWARQSAAYLQRLLAGKALEVVTAPSDGVRDGRVGAYLYAGAGPDRILVNLEMIRAGWAFAYAAPSNPEFAQVFSDAESEARAAGRGVWAPAAPLQESPAAFRRRTAGTAQCPDFTTRADAQRHYDEYLNKRGAAPQLLTDGQVCPALP